MRLVEKVSWAVIAFIVWLGISLALFSLPMVNSDAERRAIGILTILGTFASWEIIMARK